MAVNALVTGLIVFKILKVYLEVNAQAASTSVKRNLGSTGGTPLRHIVFVIIESGMAFLTIQLARVVLVTLRLPVLSINDVIAIVIAIHQMHIVIIRSHFYFFCFTDSIYLSRTSHQQ